MHAPTKTAHTTAPQARMIPQGDSDKSLTDVPLSLQIPRMPTQEDPKWEVVDELPNEKKPKARPRPLSSLIRSKALWTGVIVGVVAVIVFPILRVVLQNLIRSWWIWVGILGIWYWRRMKRMR